MARSASRRPCLVKLFGERNTATRAVQKLFGGLGDWLPGTATEIDEAAFRQIAADHSRSREDAIDRIFEAAPDRAAWKHCATDFDDPAAFGDCLVLFTVRHPASWLTGLFANPYHALAPLPATIGEFLDFEWETVGRERLSGKSFRPLDLYNAKLRSYSEFSRRLEDAGVPYRFLRFEDMVLRQEHVFRTVAAALGAPDAPFAPLKRSTKDRRRTLGDYQDYYRREGWREALAGSEGKVNERIDWSLAAPFGYAPLEGG